MSKKENQNQEAIRTLKFAAGVGTVAGLVAGGLAAASRGNVPGFTRSSPSGKGVWVHSVRHAKTPAEMVENLKSVGADFAVLATIWQKGAEKGGGVKRYDLDRIPEYSEALRDAGIDPWLWGWPDSADEKIRSFVDTVVPVWERSKASGFILDIEDAEGQWKKNDGPQIRSLIGKLRKHGPVGVTTYGGGPANIPNFPWVAIAEEADFGMPQIYSSFDKYGNGYPRRAVERYHAAGFKRVIPVLSASPNRNSEYMRGYRDYTPLPDGAVSYWHYFHMFRSGNPGRARANALASFDIDGYGGLA